MGREESTIITFSNAAERSEWSTFVTHVATIVSGYGTEPPGAVVPRQPSPASGGSYPTMASQSPRAGQSVSPAPVIDDMGRNRGSSADSPQLGMNFPSPERLSPASAASADMPTPRGYLDPKTPDAVADIWRTAYEAARTVRVGDDNRVSPIYDLTS